MRRQERRVRRSSELSTIDDADDSKPVDIDDDSYQLSVLPARRFSVRDIPAPSVSSAASEDAGTGADGTGCCGRLGQKLLGSRSRVVPEGGSLSGERQRGVSAVAQNSTALCETSTPSDLKHEGLGALLTQGSQKLSSMQHTSSSAVHGLRNNTQGTQMFLSTPTGRLILNPKSNFLRKWDLVVVLLMLYTATFTPFEVSFLRGNREMTDPVWIINRIVDVCFLLDSVSNFFLPIQTKHGKWIHDLSIIRWKYVRTWLPIDIVSIIPFDTIAVATQSTDAIKFMVFRVLRVLGPTAARLHAIPSRRETGGRAGTLRIVPWTAGVCRCCGS